MKLLFIGDIFGKQGRKAIKNELTKIKKLHNVDLIIANAENVTHGRGMSFKHYLELKKMGIDYFTMGNHTWYQNDVEKVLSMDDVIRPMNLKKENKWSNVGRGSVVFNFKKKNVQLTNLLGLSTTTHPQIQTNPFIDFNDFIKNSIKPDIHIVDFHCETTSEKNAFLLEFASKVSVIVGTHTHVQTADNKIYKNTAYISDVGMCGGSEGIIGAESETIIKMFKQETKFFKLSPSNTPYQFNAVLISIDNKTNLPNKIERICVLEKSI